TRNGEVWSAGRFGGSGACGFFTPRTGRWRGRCPRARVGRSRSIGWSGAFKAAEEGCQHVANVSSARRRLRITDTRLARQQECVGRFADSDQRHPHVTSLIFVVNCLRNPVVVGRRLSKRKRVIYVRDWFENASPLESFNIELLTFKGPHHQLGL